MVWVGGARGISGECDGDPNPGVPCSLSHDRATAHSIANLMAMVCCSVLPNSLITRYIMGIVWHFDCCRPQAAITCWLVIRIASLIVLVSGSRTHPELTMQGVGRRNAGYASRNAQKDCAAGIQRPGTADMGRTAYSGNAAYLRDGYGLWAGSVVRFWNEQTNF